MITTERTENRKIRKSHCRKSHNCVLSVSYMLINEYKPEFQFGKSPKMRNSVKSAGPSLLFFVMSRTDAASHAQSGLDFHFHVFHFNVFLPDIIVAYHISQCCVSWRMWRMVSCCQIKSTLSIHYHAPANERMRILTCTNTK